jgi:dipeptidyl aminopeptidase/acylaminoacyl peptidase
MLIHHRPRFALLPTAIIGSVFLCRVLPSLAHPAAFTIDEVMQAPYPSDLTASPVSKSVAWVFDTKGVRNIWIADPSTAAKARPITSFTRDDGYDIGELAWSPDARSIAFTRGETLENDAPANVDSSPVGPSPREVWVVSVTGGTVHKIGSGHSPIYSPEGSRLVFIDKGTILTATQGQALAAAPGGLTPEPLLVDQGHIAAIAWSPDGKRLAFVSNRGSHALIGIYDWSAKTIVWMNPSLDQDTSPEFSPDGSEIAFIRIPSQKNPEIVSQRTGQPWSIWIADTATGKGRRVWIADAGPGSVFHATLSNQNLFWTPGNQLVFPWEKSGWLQLYATPAQAGTTRSLISGARSLSTGKFEVFHLTATPDRRRLIYSSNQDSIDTLHIWTLDTDHGQPQLLARTRAIEDYPQIAADGTLFALQSEATLPLAPVRLDSNGHWQRLAAEVIPSSFPSSKLATPTPVTFPAKDAQEVHAQLFLPRDIGDSKPHPSIMFFHGGPQRQMLLGFHPMGAYNWMYALNQHFVAEGYIVLSVNYRGGIGYGIDYREAKNFGPNGASELNDLLGAVDYLKARHDVDPHRLGIWGASYGGLMTALGLARASDSIAAGVDYAGLYNWATFLSAVGDPIDNAAATQRAIDSSPIATIDQWQSPVLLVQADDDRNVPSQQASELLQDLNAHHIDHDVIIIPNEIHDLARYSSWLHLFNAADAYFEQHLEKRPSTPARTAALPVNSDQIELASSHRR